MTRLVVAATAAGFALAPIALTGGPAAAVGAQRWASPTGSGTACTQASPCSVDTAVEDGSVVDGDEVIVEPGSYSTDQLTLNQAIDLHGQAGQPVPTINVTGAFGLYVGRRRPCTTST